MTDEKKILVAKKTFETLKKVLDEHNLGYDSDEDGLVIHTGGKGDDLPMRMFIFVEPEAERIQIRIPMQFDCPPEKMAECALFTCYASNRLSLGQYNLNISNGEITYVNIIYYAGSLISDEQYFTMIIHSFRAADIYNDKYLMLINNMISLGDLVNKLEEGNDSDEEKAVNSMNAEELALKKLINMYKENPSNEILNKIYLMNAYFIGKKIDGQVVPATYENSIIAFCSGAEGVVAAKKINISISAKEFVFKGLLDEAAEFASVNFVIDDFILPQK